MVDLRSVKIIYEHYFKQEACSVKAENKQESTIYIRTYVSTASKTRQKQKALVKVKSAKETHNLRTEQNYKLEKNSSYRPPCMEEKGTILQESYVKYETCM